MEIQPPLTPVLASPATRLPTGLALPGGCVYEPKYDGFRSLLFRLDGEVYLQSRAGNDLTDAFPDIAAAALSQLSDGVVVDGELVVLGESGGLDFRQLQARNRAGPARISQLVRRYPASLVIFDVLRTADQELMSQPLHARRALLEELLADCAPPLQLTPQSDEEEQAREWLDQFAAASIGLEGVVIKGRNQRYEPGRRLWRKLRLQATREVVLAGVTGTLAQPRRLVFGIMADTNELVMTGSSYELTAAQRTELAPLLQQPDPDHPWRGKTAGQQLVRPLVVEVAGDQSLTGSVWRGQMRFVRARPDLSPEETFTP